MKWHLLVITPIILSCAIQNQSAKPSEIEQVQFVPHHEVQSAPRHEVQSVPHREVKQVSPTPPVESQPQPSLLTVQVDKQEWTLDLHEIGFDGIDPTTLDRQQFFAWIDQVEKEVNRPPISAHFVNRKLIAHQTGRTVNRKEIEGWLDQIHDYLNHPVQLPIISKKPELTTAKVRQLKEKRLGSYYTYFNKNNSNRAHNIYLSVKAIDHYILLPGQVFSFNKVVGMRTVARGYRPARIIVRGEYSEGVGGGICQTSSTLFNSVDAAGLQIVERVSHSKQVTYVPERRDATVSWGGPDFKFQNQLNEPILIIANARYGVLGVIITGPQTTQYKHKDIPALPKPSPNEQVEHEEPVKKIPAPIRSTSH